MILSHKLKCIFFAIPKTATHAIRNGIRPHLEEGDEEQVGLFVQKRYSETAIAQIGHGHITCQQLKASVGDEIWNSYFKFSFVRNPYDRFVSYCAFMQRNNPDFKERPQNYMYHALMNKKSLKHILFRPQSEFVCDPDDKSMVDYIGRYESLQASYDEVCLRLNISKSPLIHINESNHQPYRDYYNDELREMVYKMYKNDFELFYPDEID